MIYIIEKLLEVTPSLLGLTLEVLHKYKEEMQKIVIAKGLHSML